MAYPEIQSYIGPSTPVDGVSQAGALIDGTAATPLLYLISAGSSSWNGIRKFEIASGSQTDEATLADLYGAVSPYRMAAPISLGFDGKFTTSPRDNPLSAYYATFALIDSSDFSRDATYDLDGLAVNHQRTAGFIAPASVDGKYYSVVVTPSVVDTKIYVMETHGTTCIFAGHQHTYDEVQAAPGQTIAGSGIVYTVGFGPNSSGGTITPIGLYKTQIVAGADGYSPASWPGSPNPDITTTKLGTISPSDVDATWSHFYNATGPGYDQTDGNLLVFVSTADSVTHKGYLLKLDATDASIIWATAIGGTSVPLYPFNSHGSIKDGVYAYANGTTLYRFDTTDGSITSQTTLDGVTIFGSTYDGDTNSLFCYGSYTGSTSNPTPIGGTTSFTGQWFRLTLGAIAPPLAGSDEGWFAVMRAVTP